MADIEETAAQRQARIRRQKRETKITGAGQERLDKITKLSGRTPESMRNDTSTQTPPRSSTPLINQTTGQQFSSPDALQQGLSSGQSLSPEQLKMQEEYFRQLMRASNPPPQAGQGPAGMEDPMMQLLGQMLAGVDGAGNPQVPEGGPPAFSPQDISKATGLPSFVTNMMMGDQRPPPPPGQIRRDLLWKILHTVFAVLVGIYLVYTIQTSTAMFGANPPTPATFRNPFIVFTTGEALVQGARIAEASRSGQSGIKFWWRVLNDICADGAIVVFALGAGSWWMG